MERKQQLLRLCSLPGVRLVFIGDILNSVQAHLAPKQAEPNHLAGMGLPSPQLAMRTYELER